MQASQHPSDALFEEFKQKVNIDDDEILSVNFLEQLKLIGREVYTHMQRYDGSHDWQHISRVMRLAWTIYSAESARGSTAYNPALVLLAPLTHDIADKKYRDSNTDGKDVVVALLSRHHVTVVPVDVVATVVEHVSYSNEVQNPMNVKAVLEAHPELGIVQDADRIDALGVVGIGRTFTFGGAKGTARGMEDTMAHFDEKLLKLVDLMKTDSGLSFAIVRTERLKVFATWWKDETKPCWV